MSRAFTKERDDVPEPAPALPQRHKTTITEAPRRKGEVSFGATVVVEGAGPEPRSFTIVAEDESDPVHGRIAIDAPLAQALLGKRAGQNTVWRRPAGDLRLHIVSVTDP